MTNNTETAPAAPLFDVWFDDDGTWRIDTINTTERRGAEIAELVAEAGYPVRVLPGQAVVEAFRAAAEFRGDGNLVELCDLALEAFCGMAGRAQFDALAAVGGYVKAARS